MLRNKRVNQSVRVLSKLSARGTENTSNYKHVTPCTSLFAAATSSPFGEMAMDRIAVSGSGIYSIDRDSHLETQEITKISHNTSILHISLSHLDSPHLCISNSLNVPKKKKRVSEPYSLGRRSQPNPNE